MPTILHIGHEDRSADILASEVTSIVRLAAKAPAAQDFSEIPARTRIEYGRDGSGITLPITREEHDALVAAWRSAV